MKNCLSFKALLLPVITIFLSLTITQTEAQTVRILNSNPRGGGGGDELCIEKTGINFAFYMLIDKGVSVELTSIKVGGYGDEIVAETFVEESYGSNNNNNNNITSPDNYRLWKCYFSTASEFLNYVSEPSTALGVNFEISYTEGTGNGSVHSSILNTGNGLSFGGGTTTESLYLSFCTNASGTVDPPPGGGNNSSRKATKQQTGILVSDIHPNPATNQISLEFSTTAGTKVSIAILDQLGRLTRNITSEDDANEGINTRNIDISDLSKGLYYIRISSKDEVVTKKILKL